MIKLVPWSDDAERQILRAASPDTLPLIRDEVQLGIAQLWHAKDDFADCYIVTRLETRPVEWVFVAAAGRGVFHYGRMMVAEGKRRQLSMRCHVISGSVLRLWRKLGFQTSEYVLRVAA